MLIDVPVKTDREIELLRAAGRVARAALDAACAAARAGITTAELDRIAEDVIRELGATPEFKGYQDFPAATCISVGDEVVHGIPGPRRLVDGDLVSIDVGARLHGYVGDNARTVIVGEGTEVARRVNETAEECLRRAIQLCRPGGRLSDLGRAIQAHAESQGFHVVRDYAGHGIGARLHEEPQVHNYVDESTLSSDVVLEPGMCLAIEPMIVAGGPGVRVLADQWTVVTTDGSVAAHWEDVVAVTQDGPRILTRP